MHPPDTIATERLLLRRAREHDAQALFDAYASDPQATRYLSWRTHETVDDTSEFLAQAESSWADGSEFIWVLIPGGGADPMGALGAAVTPHGMEIGYVLGRDWWGRGLATEAVTAVMAWLRAQPSVYRVWAYCAEDHIRSARVLERSGMTYEATLRRWIRLPNLSDEPVDARVYAWTRQRMPDADDAVRGTGTAAASSTRLRG